MTYIMRYILVLVGLTIFGCTTAQTPTDINLPLSETQPTFLLFYTDN